MFSLVKSDEDGLTIEKWEILNINGSIGNDNEFFRLVYFGGVDSVLRKQVWPYLLGHYSFGSTAEDRQRLDETCKHYYETTMSEWLAVDAIVQQREKEKTARAVAKLSSGSNTSGQDKTIRAVDADTDAGGELDNEVFEDISDISDPGDLEFENEQHKESTQMASATSSSSCHLTVKPIPRAMKTSTDSGNVDDNTDDLNVEEEQDDLKIAISQKTAESLIKEEMVTSPHVSVANISNKSTPSTSSYDTVGNGYTELKTEQSLQYFPVEEMETKSILSPEYLSADDFQEHLNEDETKTAVIVTNASVDIVNWETSSKVCSRRMSPVQEHTNQTVFDALLEPKSTCVSPASSNGGVYSVCGTVFEK